ncbi:esterase-like activity of phytase family protein [Ferrimonas kyonanensis]|uniref:esterase-like activity of phytase family protein n=1 Tax=Ferrimonas kyonanensis TaxID=364763 RepID=UPI000685BF21|nr:esterase-like activity of phytase family protein [Ferrimonas kyonanensis]
MWRWWMVAVACLSQPVWASVPGFSGMAPLDGRAFVVVLDRKSDAAGERLGIVRLTPSSGYEYRPVRIDDWHSPDGQASDLESLCALPGRDGEFLLAESGTWQGRFGRVFHVHLEGDRARVMAVYPLPRRVDSKPGIEGDNVEGMVCLASDRGFKVIIAERGGSRHYPEGVVRLGEFEPQSGRLNWLDAPLMRVTAPGPQRPGRRAISDLYLDADGTLWASATDDGGDAGPFRSLIYSVAQLNSAPAGPLLRPVQKRGMGWIIDGFKVEALSGPAAGVAGSVMSFATEDEHYPGVWRPLLPPSTDFDALQW